jgi:DNA-binding CsgD family transcriptional regulator
MRHTYSGSCKLDGEMPPLPRRQETRSARWVEVRVEPGCRAGEKSTIASMLSDLVQELVLLGQMALQQEDTLTACSLLEASATLARRLQQEQKGAELTSPPAWAFAFQGNKAEVSILAEKHQLPGRKREDRELIVPGMRLSAREVEVLRLVALGLTDAQVAQQLVISRRTVNWHLTAIYNKLGVSSRSAATRYAIEQQVI